MAATGEYIRDVLNQLRDEKTKQHLTCEEIEQLTAEKGIYVHLRTIRRVMQPDGDDINYRLSTLRNIAVAMGTDLVNKEANETLARERVKLEEENKQSQKTMIENLRIIEKYEATIKALTEQIDSMRKTIHGQDAHLATLLCQAEKHEKNVRRKDLFLHIYTVTFVTMLLSLIILFATDVLVLVV